MKMRTKKAYRYRRHLRVRKRVSGTAIRPRLSVHISNRHIRVQFVDDEAGRTLASVTTLDSSMSSDGPPPRKVNVRVAADVGRRVGEIARKQGIQSVVFDRGGFAFAGRMGALADAAREAGLKI